MYNTFKRDKDIAYNDTFYQRKCSKVKRGALSFYSCYVSPLYCVLESIRYKQGELGRVRNSGPALHPQVKAGLGGSFLGSHIH